MPLLSRLILWNLQAGSVISLYNALEAEFLFVPSPHLPNHLLSHKRLEPFFAPSQMYHMPVCLAI